MTLSQQAINRLRQYDVWEFGTRLMLTDPKHSSPTLITKHLTEEEYAQAKPFIRGIVESRQ